MSASLRHPVHVRILRARGSAHIPQAGLRALLVAALALWGAKPRALASARMPGANEVLFDVREPGHWLVRATSSRMPKSRCGGRGRARGARH